MNGGKCIGSVLLLWAAVACGGCDSCNRCNDPSPAPFAAHLVQTFWIAKVPADDAGNAGLVGQVLGRKCVGTFLRWKNELYVVAESKEEAACVRKLLSDADGSIKITFVDKGAFEAE